MKFKPKTDTRAPPVQVKQEEEEEAPLSEFQRQRLQQQQNTAAPAATSNGQQQQQKGATAGQGDASKSVQVKTEGTGQGTGASGQRKAREVHIAQTANTSSYSTVVVKTEDVAPNTSTDLTSFIDPTTEDERFLPMVGSESGSIAVKKDDMDIKDDDEAPPKLPAPAKEAKDPGTAFLEVDKEEAAERRRENLRFFSEASASADPNAQKLLWIQLPSPQQARSSKTNRGAQAAPSLSELPPGQIGKLRVRRSGKTELVINDMVYEVSMESAEEHQSMSQEVVAVVPNYSGGQESLACYQLGVIDRKAVCVSVPQA